MIDQYPHPATERMSVAVTQATPCVGEQPCGNNMPVCRSAERLARAGRASKRCGQCGHTHSAHTPNDTLEICFYTDID
jgi:hypothetical protein